jgi:site-specific recombinase XerD
MPVARAAELLGLSKKTVIRWCERGKLPAIPKAYGNKTTYLISPSALELLAREETAVSPIKNESSLKTPHPKPHRDLVKPWITAMQRGLITGKPFSSVTIRDYDYYVGQFLAAQPAVSLSALQTELLKTPIHQYGKRFKLYKAVVCFAKYLIREEAIDRAFLEEVKPLYPKRHLPPKRLTVDEEDINKLIDAAKTPFQRMMVVVLGSTGIRVSEAAALRWEDVDLPGQSLTVRLGKGNKSRPIGLSLLVVAVLGAQLKAVESQWVFSDEEGAQLTRMGLYHRLKRLGENAGVKVSPHALRRAFVTINAGKGRPLVYLQKACGHSDIKTTMSYCRTTEQEVVDAMKGWD